MKKMLLICLMLLLVLSFAACDKNPATDSNGSGDGDVVASESDLSLYPTASALPEYKGSGEVVYPWEDVSSGFWVQGATLDDMKSYGDKLVKNDWTLKDSVADYDPEAVLYYSSTDESQTLQLKFMGDSYIRVTVGAPADVEGLE
jgi:hypothetical protein